MAEKIQPMNPFDGTLGPQDLTEKVNELIEQVNTMAKALDELNPGWEYGAHAPACNCASCAD